MELKKRFGVLLCAEESEYIKKQYGGNFQVFVGLLGEEGEEWDSYRAFDGELPTDEDIHLYDGFVITGSCSDAHGNEIWILDLVHLLKRLDSLRKVVLGICFGHQILSRALGGKTGRASKGGDIGVTCIHPSPSLCSIPSHLPIIEFHRDEVWDPPPHAEVIARSDRTRIEMFRCGDHIMGIQGHPEYNKDILLHLVDRLLQRKLINRGNAEAARASLSKTEPRSVEEVMHEFPQGKIIVLIMEVTN